MPTETMLALQAACDCGNAARGALAGIAMLVAGLVLDWLLWGDRQ